MTNITGVLELNPSLMYRARLSRLLRKKKNEKTGGRSLVFVFYFPDGRGSDAKSNTETTCFCRWNYAGYALGLPPPPKTSSVSRPAQIVSRLIAVSKLSGRKTISRTRARGISRKLSVGNWNMSRYVPFVRLRPATVRCFYGAGWPRIFGPRIVRRWATGGGEIT